MNWFLPLALLAAAHGEEAEHEETISDVVMHHISNSDITHPAVAGWAMSKAVVFMLIAAVLLIVLLGWALRRSRITGKAPQGITNALESVVLFIRDQIAIENMGKKYGRMFTPFLCTLFFFILTCNLLGMVLPRVAFLEKVAVVKGRVDGCHQFGQSIHVRRCDSLDRRSGKA
jgi:F0F1-type ATP synthase membrane subunit a